MNKASNINPANLLTLVRILLVPIFFIFCFYSNREEEFTQIILYNRLSLLTLLVIIFTDVADGFIARRFNLETPLGAMLDPLADKLFVSASFILLASFGRIPAWLTIVVVTKDLLLLFGWLVLFILNVDIQITASKAGKACAGMQYATVCAVIIPLPQSISLWGLWPATAVLTVVAFFSYALDALEKANRRTPIPPPKNSS